jgi:hypothetical protein
MCGCFLSHESCESIGRHWFFRRTEKERLAHCNVENAFADEKLIPLEIASCHIYPSNVTAEAQAFSTLNRVCLLPLRLCLGTKDLDPNAEI